MRGPLAVAWLLSALVTAASAQTPQQYVQGVNWECSLAAAPEIALMGAASVASYGGNIYVLQGNTLRKLTRDLREVAAVQLPDLPEALASLQGSRLNLTCGMNGQPAGGTTATGFTYTPLSLAQCAQQDMVQGMHEAHTLHTLCSSNLSADAFGVYVLRGGRLTVYDTNLRELRNTPVTQTLTSTSGSCPTCQAAINNSALMDQVRYRGLREGVGPSVVETGFSYAQPGYTYPQPSFSYSQPYGATVGSGPLVPVSLSAPAASGAWSDTFSSTPAPSTPSASIPIQTSPPGTATTVTASMTTPGLPTVPSTTGTVQAGTATNLYRPVAPNPIIPGSGGGTTSWGVTPGGRIGGTSTGGLSVPGTVTTPGSYTVPGGYYTPGSYTVPGTGYYTPGSYTMPGTGYYVPGTSYYAPGSYLTPTGYSTTTGAAYTAPMGTGVTGMGFENVGVGGTGTGYGSSYLTPTGLESSIPGISYNVGPGYNVGIGYAPGMVGTGTTYGTGAMVTPMLPTTGYGLPSNTLTGVSLPQTWPNPIYQAPLSWPYGSAPTSTGVATGRTTITGTNFGPVRDPGTVGTATGFGTSGASTFTIPPTASGAGTIHNLNTGTVTQTGTSGRSTTTATGTTGTSGTSGFSSGAPAGTAPGAGAAAAMSDRRFAWMYSLPLVPGQVLPLAQRNVIAGAVELGYAGDAGGPNALHLQVIRPDGSRDSRAQLTAYVYPRTNVDAGRTVRLMAAAPGTFSASFDPSTWDGDTLAVKVRRPGMKQQTVYFSLARPERTILTGFDETAGQSGLAPANASAAAYETPTSFVEPQRGAAAQQGATDGSCETIDFR